LASAFIILSVQYMEHTRSRNPNGVVLFYWLLLIIVLAVKLRSLISQQMHRQHIAYFVTFCVAFGLACAEFALEYIVPKKLSDYDALGDEFECPYNYADVFSILTFGWMSPLMKLGYEKYLTQDDLWNLRTRDSSKKTVGDFRAAWAIEAEKKRPSLFLAIARAYGGPFLRGGLVKVLSDVSQFLQPQLLRLLIAFVSSYQTSNPQPVIRGCAISLGMFALSVTYTSCQHQYFQRVYETGMRVRSGLTAVIYEKSTRLSNSGRAAKTTGDIVNLMAVDTQRLDQVMQFVQQIWSAPFQIFLAMASLYQLVGPSMFAGVGIMLIMIPINGVIVKYLRQLSIKQMSNKDVRTKLMSEILNNIKSIKLHAWTRAFSNKLNEVRNNLELAMLRKKAVVQTLSNFTLTTTPFFVSFATFSIFALTSDVPLTAELVFPALSFFNLLQFPLQVFPMVINAIVEASVSADRITAFLLAEELQPDAVRIEDAAAEAGDESVRVRGGSFTWNTGDGKNLVLKDVNFSANKGELTCIVGRVGSGKSSLLQAILGDLHKIAGEVVVHGTTAYVAQTPWIMNSSVKDNITFGYRYDPIFYEQTVKACALVDDIAILPDGDQTLVGERGISLSGGQKARIALARAVYARADVYILDDVLSAVDQHVGRHIINNVLGPRGLLAGKARVLATNAIPVLREAEYVVLVRDGRILERGTYEQLVAMKGEIAGIISAAIADEDGASEESASPLSASTASQETVFVSEGDEVEGGSPEDTLGSLEPIRSAVAAQRLDGVRRTSTGTLRRASTASAKGARGGKALDEEAGNRVEASKEHQEQGKVKWSVYGEYASSANMVAVVIWVIALVSAQAAQIGTSQVLLGRMCLRLAASSVWLKTWSDANDENGGNRDAGQYIGIYFAFGIGYSILVLLQTMLLWLFCSLEVCICRSETRLMVQASRKLHERMAHAIFRSPMTFFETTPTGRILNRFSKWVFSPCRVALT
jgi:ABC-type multidrug transport system fused ATPase/permease subunit